MAAIAPINLNLARLNPTQQKTLAELQYKIDHHIKLSPTEQAAYDKFLKLAMAAATQPTTGGGGSCSGASQSAQTAEPEPDPSAKPGTNPEDPNKPPIAKTHHAHKGHKGHHGHHGHHTATPPATAAGK